MKTVEIDFHYYFVEEAIRVTEGIINYSRMNDERLSCYFITGRGKIQKELMVLLKETYGLEPVISVGNTGVILVDVY